MTMIFDDVNPVSRLAGVSLRRQGEHLLSGLNVTVKAGEHWAFLGPNGAGKTLVLRMMTGYLWPSEGEVTLLGRKLGSVDLRELRKSVAWVSRALEYLAPEEALVREIILSGLTASFRLYFNPGPQETAAAEAQAECYGLSDLLNRPFGCLSSGEKQRTFLARAALGRPKLLLLDEPLANLDLGGREMLLGHLESLAKSPQPPAMVLVTHHLEEIGSFVNRALLLKKGRSLAAGPVAEVLTEELLSLTFGLPLEVSRTASGRWLAQGRKL